MATIEFTTNLHSFQNEGEWQFHPNFFEGKDAKGNKIGNSVPNEAGVYIVGVKIPVSEPPQLFDINGNLIKNSEAVEKFCPLLVGETQDLRKRLIEHRRNGSSGYLNGKKELFDFVNFQPLKFYSDIKYFDTHYITLGKRLGLTRNHFFKNIVFNTLSQYPYSNSLIWFPDCDFFNKYLKTTYSSFGLPGHVFRPHSASIKIGGDLDCISSVEADKLKDNIIDVKARIYKSFWYAFASQKDNEEYSFINQSNRERIETITKWKVKEIPKISTYATIQRGSYNIWDGLDQGLVFDDIDLTDIKADLVNMTGKLFPLTSGKFII